MPTTHRIAALAAVLAALCLLSGCVGESPQPSPSPDPTSTPVFASEEEALAAATEAYEEYQAVVDEAFMTWDAKPLSTVAVDPALDAGTVAVAEYESAGERQVGASAVDSLALEDPAAAVAPSGESTALYTCLDVSEVDVENTAGESVVPADRSVRFPLRVTLHWSEVSVRFLVEEEAQWDGQNFCE